MQKFSIYAAVGREHSIEERMAAIAEAGFDTCPEIFNPENELESPYKAPEINSACHAWSCTPTYFIRKYGLGK